MGSNLGISHHGASSQLAAQVAQSVRSSTFVPCSLQKRYPHSHRKLRCSQAPAAQRNAQHSSQNSPARYGEPSSFLESWEIWIPIWQVGQGTVGIRGNLLSSEAPWVSLPE